MKYTLKLIQLLLLMGIFAIDNPATAQSLEKRVEELEKELRSIKTLPSESEGGEAGSKLTFHGYGEIHYNHPVVEGTGIPSGDLNPTLDFHRLVLGWGYHFNDRLSVHVEFDFEHAAQELELEYAYLEYQWTDALNFRAGSLLMPVGPLNEFHEPPLFYSVERPYVQKYIVPTSWQEGGAGLFGQPLTGVNYRIYLVEGLDAKGFSENGIKDGRQVLFEDTNRAFNFGGVGRLEYNAIPGLGIGTSYYSAGASQGNPGIGSAHVTLWDVDGRARLKGFDFTALYARTHISGADRITASIRAPFLAGDSPDDPGTVGSEQFGWYVEGAYHLGQLIKSEWDLVPFVRREEFDTQSKVPAGMTKNPATDRKVLTYGLAFYPHPDVALKADWERWKDGTGADGSRYNLGMAFMF